MAFAKVTFMSSRLPPKVMMPTLPPSLLRKALRSMRVVSRNKATPWLPVVARKFMTSVSARPEGWALCGAWPQRLECQARTGGGAQGQASEACGTRVPHLSPARQAKRSEKQQAPSCNCKATAAKMPSCSKEGTRRVCVKGVRKGGKKRTKEQKAVAISSRPDCRRRGAITKEEDVCHVRIDWCVAERQQNLRLRLLLFRVTLAKLHSNVVEPELLADCAIDHVQAEEVGRDTHDALPDLQGHWIDAWGLECRACAGRLGAVSLQHAERARAGGPRARPCGLCASHRSFLCDNVGQNQGAEVHADARKPMLSRERRGDMSEGRRASGMRQGAGHAAERRCPWLLQLAEAVSASTVQPLEHAGECLWLLAKA